MLASAADVAAAVCDARRRGATLRIVGGATWQDAGAECAATERLELQALAGIVEYEPGDLTLTARAGTPLRDIERVTAEHGQWLPLEPFGHEAGTLGATVATASYGPLASAYGTGRNQVLGCEVVTGAGDIVRAGGRVVKNVAGFDVTRLMVGAWGTLGAITEVSVRLRARPEVDLTLAIALGDVAAVERAQRWLRHTEFTPLAAELLSSALAVQLGIASAGASVLLLRLGGNEALIRAARHAATALGGVVELDAGLWRRFARAEAAAAPAATIRLSGAPAAIAPLWRDVLHAVEPTGGVAHATLTRGVVRCLAPMTGDAAVERLRSLLAALPPGTRIAERLPRELWPASRMDRATNSLSAGIQRVFDPDGLFNPGIMGPV